jgi:hypothetical protein
MGSATCSLTMHALTCTWLLLLLLQVLGHAPHSSHHA